MKYIALSIIVFYISGCTTLDSTTDISSTCSVHHNTMSIKKLDLLTGYEGYVQDYYDHMKAAFPNYDGARWGHIEFLRGARWANCYICDKCTNAFKKYWSTRNKSG